MPVTFSPAAERDLESIGDYIAKDNPLRAVSFIGEIREQCRLIEAAPLAAVRRDDIAEGIRMVVHKQYLIFYSVNSTGPRIERVLHAARNIDRIVG